MDPSEFHKEQKVDIQIVDSIFYRTKTSDFIRFSNHGKFFLKKIISQLYCNDIRYKTALKNEFDVGISLDHPNIVRYVDYVENENEQYLVMDFIDGQNLSDFIKFKSNTLSYTTFFKHIKQLLDCLSYLHSKQIYHLDLKPQNIMITHRGLNVKLIDFGFACNDGSFDVKGVTKSYSPPEQANGQFGPSSDIYSLGIIMKEYLSYLDVPKYIKLKWEIIIESCIELEQSKRYSDVVLIDKEISKLEAPIKKRKIYYTILLLSVLLVVALFLYKIKIKKESISDKSLTNIHKESSVFRDTNLTISHSSNIAAINNLVEIPAHKISTDKLLQNTKPDNFNINDSLYITNLGYTLVKTFDEEYSKSQKTPKESLVIQSRLTDSIQNIWFKYSNKFNSNSKEYAKAFLIYTNSVTKAQIEIMNKAFK